ncbi:MAG: DUF389 domain-containing protein [Synechococcus sp.]
MTETPVLTKLIDKVPKMLKALSNLFKKRSNRMPLIDDSQIEILHADLLEESRLSLNYLVLCVGSAGIATMGLIANNAAVIVGAMIVAPLISPIRGLAFGILTQNNRLTKYALRSVLVGAFIGLFISYAIAVPIRVPLLGSEILARTRPNVLDLVVAIFSGAIAIYARVRPKLADSLAGVAIAVALMPPLCVAGIGLAEREILVTRGAMALYITNLVGISLACMVVLILMGQRSQQRKLFSSSRVRGALLLLVGIIVAGFSPLMERRARFVKQDILERELKVALLQDTLTFQRIELLSSDFNWSTSPPEVILLVVGEQALNSNQVRLIEEHIAERLSQEFKLVFRFIPFEHIESSS